MDRLEAEEILLWRYVAPYDFYNMDNSEEALAELLDGSYNSVYTGDGSLFGYFCRGNSAQVPAGHASGAYLDACLDVGLGMNPYLTGSGRGSSFFKFILNSLYDEYGRETVFRLTVASFNKRAVTLYTRHGFMKVVSFQHNGVEFVSMIKPPLIRRF
jgi:hypothetical protein